MLLFFFTLVTGPRSLSLKLSDTRVMSLKYEPASEPLHSYVPGVGARVRVQHPTPHTPWKSKRPTPLQGASDAAPAAETASLALGSGVCRFDFQVVKITTQRTTKEFRE